MVNIFRYRAPTLAGFFLVVISAQVLWAQTAGSGSVDKRSDQASLPSFEAVSIKPASSTAMAYFDGDPGYSVMRGVSADLLVGRAYNLHQFQIVGLPSWAKNKNYNIETKTDAATVAKLQTMPFLSRIAYQRLMFQSLLADRFKLRVHYVTVEANGYLLVVVKPKKLHPDDCATKSSAGAAPQCGENIQYPGHIELKSAAIAGGGSLIQSLEIFTGSTVLDRTDLTGRYDITLDWTPDPGQVAAPGIPVPPPDPNGPSLQTALRETLGLKLVSAKVPMKTIAIDQIEEPTAN